MMVRRNANPPRWPLAASIGLHLLLIGGLIWANFRQPPVTEALPAAVELWTSAPPPPPSEAVKVAPAPVAKPEPAPAPEPAPPLDTRDAEVKLGKQEPKHHKLVEPKPQPEVKHKPVPKPVEPPPPEKKPVEKKPIEKHLAEKAPVEKKPAPAPEKPQEKAKPKPAPVETPKPMAKAKEHPSGKGTKTAPRYNNEADDLLSSLDSTNTTRKGNAKIDQAGGSTGVAGGSASGNGVNLSGYKSQVVARIRPLVQIPDSMQGNPAVEVRVRVLPDMSVSSVTLVKSSGNTAYDEAVQRAIREAGNFPPRPAGADPGLFRSFNLIFRPH
ncbi:cell envelope integrity protein TolA [Crenobacter sp. SG2303]|uniref:Cell envelope integrity protein TolA n=1 Tax=Crenobacter oryzisoli TaxID=3056844 RepID=A0ABT7XJF3_9NEIS|nr:cell envelope integrity protein TolA [Crenobacter sp. SG2303]MDN0073924.1 cell envelope integrity protein TolA [Crenobacter sp. SG2303]